MRVTIVTETYYPQVNGVSRTLGQLVRYLTEVGDEVQLLHPRYGPDEPVGPRTVQVRSWPLPFYKELRLPLPPFGRAKRAVDAFQPDLIHIATEATLGLSLLLHAQRKSIPVVSSFHTNFDQYSGHYGVGWARGLIWRYLRWFHNRTLEVYVPSPATIQDLAQRGFERLVLWPRGVDSHLFRPDRDGRARVRTSLGFKDDQVVVGYVGRIAVEKNVDYLGQALGRVASQRPNARFLFVGDGPARAKLEVEIGSHARFVGYRQAEDLADHYAAADLFAFSSLTETFGNVILEAMASGLPVVALRAGGVGNIINSGKDGELLEPNQPPAEFAERLVQLIDDGEKRRRLAAAARQHALGQSWDAIMHQFRQNYERIVQREPNAPLAPSLSH